MRDHLITDLAETVKKPSKKPTSAGQVRRSSGTLIAWDPAELRGSVLWEGTTIHDVPVLGALDAFSWGAGDEVVVDTIPSTSGGFSSPMILGRVFRPGAANAAKVLQALQTEFAKQVSAEVFAERIAVAEDADAGTRAPNDTWGNLTGSAVGPAVTVNIGTTGVAVVFISAHFAVSTFDNAAWWGLGGAVSFEATGANSVAPGNQRALLHALGGVIHDVVLTDSAVAFASRIRGGNFEVLTGLNPGETTITMKYQAFSGNPHDVEFSDRDLTVIAF